jgi:hypothetical protein
MRTAMVKFFLVNLVGCPSSTSFVVPDQIQVNLQRLQNLEYHRKVYHIYTSIKHELGIG